MKCAGEKCSRSVTKNMSLAKEKHSIIARITNQQKLWIGHNLRHPDNLLTLAIEGRFISKRGQGRKRCTFLDRLKSGEDYGY